MRSGVTMTTHAAREGHLASHGVSGVHRRRRHGPRRDGGRRQFRHDRRPGDVPRAALGRTSTGWMLCDIYFPNGKPVPFSTRQLYRDALRKLATPGFDFFAGLEVEFQLFKLENPKLSPDGLTWPAEPPAVEPHHARLPVSHRVAVRSGRADPRRAAQDRAGARHAAAVAGGGTRPEPVRVHLRAGDGPRVRRHDGAVPQRHEAGGAAARPSRQLHVPAAIAEHVRQRLASASVAARSQDPARTLFVSNDKTELLSPLGRHYLARSARACARGGGVRHADRQRLQALSRRQLDGADPGDLGAATIAA